MPCDAVKILLAGAADLAAAGNGKRGSKSEGEGTEWGFVSLGVAGHDRRGSITWHAKPQGPVTHPVGCGSSTLIAVSEIMACRATEPEPPMWWDGLVPRL